MAETTKIDANLIDQDLFTQEEIDAIMASAYDESSHTIDYDKVPDSIIPKFYDALQQGIKTPSKPTQSPKEVPKFFTPEGQFETAVPNPEVREGLREASQESGSFGRATGLGLLNALTPDMVTEKYIPSMHKFEEESPVGSMLGQGIGQIPLYMGASGAIGKIGSAIGSKLPFLSKAAKNSPRAASFLQNRAAEGSLGAGMGALSTEEGSSALDSATDAASIGGVIDLGVMGLGKIPRVIKGSARRARNLVTGRPNGPASLGGDYERAMRMVDKKGLRGKFDEEAFLRGSELDETRQSVESKWNMLKEQRASQDAANKSEYMQKKYGLKFDKIPALEKAERSSLENLAKNTYSLADKALENQKVAWSDLRKNVSKDPRVNEEQAQKMFKDIASLQIVLEGTNMPIKNEQKRLLRWFSSHYPDHFKNPQASYEGKIPVPDSVKQDPVGFLQGIQRTVADIGTARFPKGHKPPNMSEGQHEIAGKTASDLRARLFDESAYGEEGAQVFKEYGPRKTSISKLRKISPERMQYGEGYEDPSKFGKFLENPVNQRVFEEQILPSLDTKVGRQSTVPSRDAATLSFNDYLSAKRATQSAREELNYLKDPRNAPTPYPVSREELQAQQRYNYLSDEIPRQRKAINEELRVPYRPPFVSGMRPQVTDPLYDRKNKWWYKVPLSGGLNSVIFDNYE